MKAPRYFVVVFGNPAPHKDRVDSGLYTGGENYPKFTVDAGDFLLLYCTEKYEQYSMKVPGIGKVVSANDITIRYEWQPLSAPISRESLRNAFLPDDWKKMEQLGIKARRVFEISKSSFSNALRD